MDQSPVNARVAAVRPDGYISPSGLSRLSAYLKRPDVAAAFHTWKSQGLTVLIAEAVRDLIVNQPFGIAETDVPVQYGITQGLEMAYQLITDPSVLIPGVFGKGTCPAPGANVPQESFDTPADGASDK